MESQRPAVAAMTDEPRHHLRERPLSPFQLTGRKEIALLLGGALGDTPIRLAEECPSCRGKGWVRGQYDDGTAAPSRECRTCHGVGGVPTIAGQAVLLFIRTFGSL